MRVAPQVVRSVPCINRPADARCLLSKSSERVLSYWWTPANELCRVFLLATGLSRMLDIAGPAWKSCNVQQIGKIS